MGNRKLYKSLLVAALLIFCVTVGMAYAEGEIILQQKKISLGEMFKAGGIVMIVLALLSVAFMALVIYCFMFLKNDKVVPSKLRDTVRFHLSKDNITGARIACEESDSVLGRVLRDVFQNPNAVGEKANGFLESVGGRYASMLRQRISYLSNIGVIAPMLGLLGTVFGMIGAFNKWSGAQGNVQSGLSGSIAEALGTTAFGLIVGIPAMGFYYYFRGRVNFAISELEETAEEVGEHLSKMPPGSLSAGADDIKTAGTAV